MESNFQRRWYELDIYDGTLQDSKFNSIINAYEIYIKNKMRNFSEKQLFKLYEEFEQAVSSKSLMEMKKNIELDEKEKLYIKYRELYHYLDNGRSTSCR